MDTEPTNSRPTSLLSDSENVRVTVAPIDPELVYGCDEVGFMPSRGSKRRVIGARNRSIQHQQGDGGRENTTVIVTICADGTATKPTVIFKGSAFNLNWNQENPAQASFAHSEKGWTDGEIGVAWIQDFHEQTKSKAQERTRLLLVDGHNSHYTRGFLRFAREHRIHVLCYPAHGTHVYQGRVVIFAPLKQYWTQEKDAYYRRTRKRITKSNFLLIYGTAHKQALTVENIKAAFRKTGVVPYNPEIVSDKLAPSKETSNQGELPAAQPTPV
ncbi:DDE-domain-containing protein, partial [Dendrothele bispora CBS 962.96]